MVYLPRVLRPLPERRTFDVPVELHFDAALSIVHGPPGAYAAETLSSLIEARGGWHHCVWLRREAASVTPLIEQLADACRHRWAAENGQRPSSSPGDVDAALKDVLRRAPVGAVVVVELGGRVTRAVARVVERLRPMATEVGISVVVVAQRHMGRSLRRAADQVIAADRLCQPASSTAGVPTPVLTASATERLAQLCGRRTTIWRDVVDAAERWPADALADAVAHARHWRSLTDRVTATLLDHADLAQRDALDVSMATGYWHPQFADSELTVQDLRPWMIPLEQQWGWVRPVWRDALASQLRRPARRALVVHRDDRPSGEPSPDGSSDRPPRTRSTVSLEARMLGHFELRVDSVAVAVSPAHRGTAVLRYLLSRTDHAAGRDEIIEEFWPDVDHAVARNRLQVAVSTVRRALREVTAASVLEYGGGSYRIVPAVDVDVDVERFDTALAAARAAERADDTTTAAAWYRRAVAAYHGDFAADAPYEQWTLLPRERLRLRYIDALDRIGQLQLAAGRTDDCIATLHRMLDVDPAREDAHRLLMQCYAAQGRVHQAMRQYELCVRVLASTLDVAAAAETVALRDAIRAGEPSLTPAGAGPSTRWLTA